VLLTILFHTHLQNITSDEFDFALFRNFTRAPSLRAERLSPLLLVLEVIIIRIIGKTALSEPKPFLEDSARFVLHLTIGFSFLWISHQ
jgi:hypothetical protein